MKRSRGVLVVTTALFVVLAALAVFAGVHPADVGVRETLLQVSSPGLIAAMRVVNHAGAWNVLLPGTLILLAFPRARERWWLWVLVLLAAVVVPDVIKIVIRRPRPEAVSFGFPSGHSTAAAAFFGTVAYLAGSLSSRFCMLTRVAALLMIFLVGVARVVLRAHWPSDVLGGFALGLAFVSAAALLDASLASRAGSAADRASSETRGGTGTPSG